MKEQVWVDQSGELFTIIIPIYSPFTAVLDKVYDHFLRFQGCEYLGEL